MEVKSDSEIRELYKDMMESMTRLVRNEKDAFSIIWFDIYGWLEPDHSAMKADLCGVLTEKIIGENIGTRIFVPNTEQYRILSDDPKKICAWKVGWCAGGILERTDSEREVFPLGDAVCVSV